MRFAAGAKGVAPTDADCGLLLLLAHFAHHIAALLGDAICLRGWEGGDQSKGQQQEQQQPQPPN